MTAPNKIESIARKSLHEELVGRLENLIIEGVLEPGQKFPERELCERYGVSRTPMREALKVLAVDGLISLEPNRGAWISRFTIEEMEEVFPVLASLEALSGELAAAKITDEEISAIRVIHDDMVRHFKAGNLTEYFHTNQEIHAGILKAARNDTLSVQHRALAVRVRRARYSANISQERWARAVDEHEEIITALEARDSQRLSAILKQHLYNKFDTLKQNIK